MVSRTRTSAETAPLPRQHRGHPGQILGDREQAHAITLLLDVLQFYAEDNPRPLGKVRLSWKDKDDRWESCYDNSYYILYLVTSKGRSTLAQLDISRPARRTFDDIPDIVRTLDPGEYPPNIHVRVNTQRTHST